MTLIGNDVIELVTAASLADDLRDDVFRGLSMQSKTLSCKFFYDKLGSELFDRICELPEYYLTRTERSIMRANIDAIAAALGPRCLIVEFGSGASTKTTFLLDHLVDPVGYVPIDIARHHLEQSAARLAKRYPDVDVMPICADFHQDLPIPEPRRLQESTVVFFPGSTIGNLQEQEARRFLDRIADTTGPRGGLLIGIDLKKPREIVVPAYDDAAGVTAEFNLNLLARINRDLGADFKLDQFRHEAVWNEGQSRMEMNLVSLYDQDVQIEDRTFRFREGERTRTEYSHKYTRGHFQRIASSYLTEAAWTDPREWFCVLLLRPRTQEASEA